MLAWAFPRTMGRTQGWDKLKMRGGMLCVPDANMILCWAVSGVQDYHPAVGLIVSVIRVIFFLRFCFGHRCLQNCCHLFLAEPFPERHQRGRSGWTWSAFLHADEILQVPGFLRCASPATGHCISAATASEAYLRPSALDEPSGHYSRIVLYTALCHIPGYRCRQSDPIVFRIQFSK